ncbi:hypothetical protein BMS3Abin12_00246 [bacterium BMS3Abin12]|nr:hypothetical protein BMS3Abin12_00246 [bacterium BMS3Abin12]GBE49696.1 hypothetical protein BMS3Bbin13_00618 [bacterium BMS3Bbin13]
MRMTGGRRGRSPATHKRRQGGVASGTEGTDTACLPKGPGDRRPMECRVAAEVSSRQNARKTVASWLQRHRSYASQPGATPPVKPRPTTSAEGLERNSLAPVRPQGPRRLQEPFSIPLPRHEPRHPFHPRRHLPLPSSAAGVGPGVYAPAAADPASERAPFPPRHRSPKRIRSKPCPLSPMSVPAVSSRIPEDSGQNSPHAECSSPRAADSPW